MKRKAFEKLYDICYLLTWHGDAPRWPRWWRRFMSRLESKFILEPDDIDDDVLKARALEGAGESHYYAMGYDNYNGWGE